MKKIQVEIEGTTPLLMHSAKGMLEETKQKVKSSAKKEFDAEEEAEKVTYRTEEGELYIPASAIRGCIIGGATYQKIGKYSAKPIVAGSIRVVSRDNDEFIRLGTDKYEIDVRTAVNRTRGRILVARPKLTKWKAKFDILYNEDMITPQNIELFLANGGQRVGLLSFRPANLGEFGQYKIVHFKEVK